MDAKTPLSPEELERYARHIVLPEIGGAGQQKLKRARVLVIGAEIPYGALKLSALNEPGLSVPLQNVTFDFQGLIPHREQCQVLVAGGGTGGAFAPSSCSCSSRRQVVRRPHFAS